MLQPASMDPLLFYPQSSTNHSWVGSWSSHPWVGHPRHVSRVPEVAFSREQHSHILAQLCPLSQGLCSYHTPLGSPQLTHTGVRGGQAPLATLHRETDKEAIASHHLGGKNLIKTTQPLTPELETFEETQHHTDDGDPSSSTSGCDEPWDSPRLHLQTWGHSTTYSRAELSLQSSPLPPPLNCIQHSPQLHYDKTTKNPNFLNIYNISMEVASPPKGAGLGST